jgi:hypothetical protein
MLRVHKLLSIAWIMACVGVATPAVASTHYGIATFVPSTYGATVAGTVTQELPIASTPLTTQAAAMVPFSGGGRYALTGEVRSPGATHVGIGAGVGKIDYNGKSGFVSAGLASIKAQRVRSGPGARSDCNLAYKSRPSG